MHIFAISGLHVACIAACFLSVLRMAGVPRDRAAFILIPLIWFYTLATGWQSSAVRSALMSTFVFAGWALRRPTELLNSLAAAAVLILFFQPEQLFQASFQLSFAVVAAIAVVLGHSREVEPWPMRLQNKLLGYDPLLPPELRPRWKKLCEIPIAFVLGNLAISGASWIGSNPLTAYYFNMVTPVSLVANLVAVPLSSVSLAMTVGSLLIPPLGPVFNYISWLTMWATIAVTRWLSHLSWGYFYVPKPNVWFFFAYFAVAAICTISALRSARVRRFSFSLAALAIVGWIYSILPSSRSTVITLLPVRGNPLVIDAPGRTRDLLVDCSNAHGAEQFVKRFLHSAGFGSIRQIVLSRGDVNHAGGLPLLRKEFSPRAVFASAARSRSRVYREVLAEIEEIPGILRTVAAGDDFAGGTILHPGSGNHFTKAEDNAVVFRTQLHGWRVLFVSDLGLIGRKALLESSDLHADVLLCGPSEAASEELLAVVSPRLVIVGGVEASRFRSRERPKPLNKVTTIASSTESAVTVELSSRSCRVETNEGWFTIEH
jgi:ComEC/Rec2-related protein